MRSFVLLGLVLGLGACSSVSSPSAVHSTVSSWESGELTVVTSTASSSFDLLRSLDTARESWDVVSAQGHTVGILIYLGHDGAMSSVQFQLSSLPAFLAPCTSNPPVSGDRLRGVWEGSGWEAEGVTLSCPYGPDVAHISLQTR